MSKRDMTTLLGGLSPREFLRKHWQKKPLLVRGAWPRFKDPVTPDELAGLAMEKDIRARLVFERGRRLRFQVETGPFAAKTFEQLPNSHWTLLVQDVNLHIDGAAAMLDRFSFLPGWRLDDVMVSFAPPHGTVGAHIDSYDVFLVQGMGRRRWQIELNPDPTLVPGLDLKILKKFRPKQEWVLERGDMLYLPPGVAHYGVALENCLTYSVGFRAPRVADILSDFIRLPVSMRGRYGGEALYEDPDLVPSRHGGEIDAGAVTRVAQTLRGALEDDELVARWFGSFITASGGDGSAAPRGAASRGIASRGERILRAEVVRRSDAHRVAFHLAKSSLFAFVDGDEFRLPRSLAKLVARVTDARVMRGADLEKLLPRGRRADDGRKLGLLWLGELAARGALFPD